MKGRACTRFARVHLLTRALPLMLIACGSPGSEPMGPAVPSPEGKPGHFPVHDLAWQPVAVPHTLVDVKLPNPDTWRAHVVPTTAGTRTDFEHRATSSTLTVVLFTADELVNRQRCERFARDRAIVPDLPLRTIDEAVTVTRDGYDTRIWVALEPGATSGDPIVGHGFAFGDSIRKCVVLHFTTKVPSAAFEATAAERLALFRTKSLDQWTVDSLVRIARQTPQPRR